MNGYKTLKENAMEYLGIPLSQNRNRMEELVGKYLEDIYNEAKALWNTRGLSLQAKFHMYQTCILSKVIYLFRGTDIQMDVREILDKIEILYKDIIGIPGEIMRLPVLLGGLGLLYLDDIRQVSRLSHLIESGKKNIPQRLRNYIEQKEEYKEGEVQHIVAKGYYKMRREEYVTKNKDLDKEIVWLLDDRQTESAHTVISSYPTNGTQVLNDIEFRIFIALRYHKDIISHTELTCSKCGKKDKTLWHI